MPVEIIFDVNYDKIVGFLVYSPEEQYTRPDRSLRYLLLLMM